MKSIIIFPLIILLISPVLFPEKNGLTIISPNGGEKLAAGSDFPVLWKNNSGSSGGNVILVLYRNGIKFRTISGSAPDTGKFLWKIPIDIPADTAYRVRIRSAEDLNSNDFSDNDFSILPKE